VAKESAPAVGFEQDRGGAELGDAGDPKEALEVVVVDQVTARIRILVSSLDVRDHDE
jgi:hypothetical protein